MAAAMQLRQPFDEQCLTPKVFVEKVYYKYREVFLTMSIPRPMFVQIFIYCCHKLLIISLLAHGIRSPVGSLTNKNLANSASAVTIGPIPVTAGASALTAGASALTAGVWTVSSVALTVRELSLNGSVIALGIIAGPLFARSGH